MRFCRSKSLIGVDFGAVVRLFVVLVRIYRGWCGRWGFHRLDLVKICEPGTGQLGVWFTSRLKGVGADL